MHGWFPALVIPAYAAFHPIGILFSTAQHIPEQAHPEHHNVLFYLPARIPPRLHLQVAGKIVAKQPKQASNDIAEACRVCHDFYWIQPGLLLKKPCQHKNGITKRTGNDMPWKPEYWSETKLYQVIPGPEPKYLRFGPELTVFTGVTKRMPSAEATSTSPQHPASGSVD